MIRREYFAMAAACLLAAVFCAQGATRPVTPERLDFGPFELAKGGGDLSWDTIDMKEGPQPDDGGARV